MQGPLQQVGSSELCRIMKPRGATLFHFDKFSTSLGIVHSQLLTSSQAPDALITELDILWDNISSKCNTDNTANTILLSLTSERN